MASNQQTVVVCALMHRIMDDTPQVFVAKRAATKKFYPGEFELPGGHVEFGEDPVTALKREFQEELNAEIRVGEPFAVFSSLEEPNRQAVEIIYFATFLDPEAPVHLNSDDHSEYRWVGLADLKSLTSQVKTISDQEFTALHRGLELLNGAPRDIA